MTELTNDYCFMCTQNVNNFSSLITHSLYGKYSSSQNFYYTKEVNEILDEAISPAYINHEDNNYYDCIEEYMKRQYQVEEFPKKNEMLSQYYKFHRDLPVWNQRPIDSIMGKYYNRLKDVDYKMIKSVLKREQGISLTTHKSFSSFDQGSDQTKRSRYSTMLNDLESSDDSLMLKSLCQKMGKALKKVKPQTNFKGTYYSGQKKFQQFLRKQKKRKEVQQKQQQAENKNKLGFKKLKFNPKLVTKDDEGSGAGLKQINFTSNHSIKDRKYPIKSVVSIEKTTANQTISREEKIRRERTKSNFNNTSSRHSISRKINTARNSIVQHLLHPSKGLQSEKILIKINNQNKKTVNQIYKSIQKTEKVGQKGLAEQGRRQSAKEFVTNLKTRSKSQSNLPTHNTLCKDPSKNKLLNSFKPAARSPSKKSILSIKAKQSIQLTNRNQNIQGVLTARQDSHRILRSSSSNKLNTNEKQYRTINLAKDTGPMKRRSAVEQMLQKKLNILKKKQPVL